jgi:TnpA family transposase
MGLLPAAHRILLKLGRVRATDIMRTLQVGEHATRLAQAIAEIGRIDNTLCVVRYLDDESMRRGTLVQLNRGEGRHGLSRVVFHGKRGELRQRYRQGQEDQLGELGLVVNMIVLCNTLYMQAAIEQLRAEGYPVLNEDIAHLSPRVHDHINISFATRSRSRNRSPGAGYDRLETPPTPSS